MMLHSCGVSTVFSYFTCRHMVAMQSNHSLSNAPVGGDFPSETSLLSDRLHYKYVRMSECVCVCACIYVAYCDYE